MFAAWSVCAILFATVFGAGAAPLEDDPLVEKVKEIIADVDEYLVSNDLTELRIPIIHLPFSPIKIVSGGLGNFSTIVLQDGSSVKERPLENNSTEYTFVINVGLQELRFHYDFEFNAVVYKRTGYFSISVLDNSAELAGDAVLGSDGSCKAFLGVAKVLKYGRYGIDIQPSDFKDTTVLAQEILNFVTPYLLPLSNSVLEATLLVPQVQKIFSEFVCKKITSS